MSNKVEPVYDAQGRAMTEIKADQFPIRRCAYCRCREQGNDYEYETLFILSDRWDNNPDLDRDDIVGSLVSKEAEEFVILADESSVGLGAPIMFQLLARRTCRA